MADLKKLREAIELSVSDVLRDRVAEMRHDIVEQVLAQIAPAIAEPPGGKPTDLLNAAIGSVQDATSQTDILKSLLDGSSRFSERCVLFVLRGNSAAGWQGRGFAENDAIRTALVDVAKGLGARVMQSRMPAAAASDEFDPAFVAQFGSPADGNVLLLPLVIKEKVAALVYADGGAKGADGLDSSALELLVRSTGLWLELLALRKAVPGETGTTAGAPAPAQRASAAVQPSVPAPAPAAVAAPATPPPTQEDEAHAKARRFAKLLVDEIKLYNQQKVADGKANHDLYDRLKDDIDKSRATYEKRYGSTLTDVDYFRQELVRILADGDASLLGSAFPS